MGRSTSWSPCSARGTGRSTCSRRSISTASSCACCRSGRLCAAVRSATPTTASPSTATCGRRPPTPPPSPAVSIGPISSCSERCSTTSARAPPAITRTRGWRSSPHRPAARAPAERRRDPRAPRAAPPAPAGRGRAARPVRPGDDPQGRRRRRRRRHARAAARPHRSRLAGDRPVGVGLVEGAARRRPRRPHACGARWRRPSGDGAAALPRRVGAGDDGRGPVRRRGPSARRTASTRSRWCAPTRPAPSPASPACCRSAASTC